MAEEEKKGKQRRPQAKKRDIQSAKRRQRNRAFKSKTSSAMRSFQALVTSKEGSAKDQLKAIYSLMDKGVKTGIFKQNKANRIKSKFSRKLLAEKK